MNRILIAFAFAALGALALPTTRTAAADLGPYPPPLYAPSPCEGLSQRIDEGLHAIRGTARLFHTQLRDFYRLKRRRHNNGFEGPDIALNAAITANQIDVANWSTDLMITVEEARRLGCLSPTRLNRADNEASRYVHTVANETIWVDPVTYR